MPRDDRERRVSAARRRAEQHSSGYETTVLRVPDGVSFFDLQPGNYVVDIIPYNVKRGKNTPGGNPFAEVGELYYERTFFCYKRIGVNEKSYVCSSKTFSKPDFIQEYRQKESKSPNADVSYLKSLNPKERQIFLIYDRKEPDKGIQVLEISFHNFGKLLDSRINNSIEEDGWDLFYFTDDSGMSLRLTVEKKSTGGYSFNEVTAIDFLRRKDPIPKHVINHKIDLDAMLIEVDYEKLKAIFLGSSDGVSEADKTQTQTDVTSSSRGATETIYESPQASEKAVTKDVRKDIDKQQKPSVASDFGLKTQDMVVYKGKVCTLWKISGDGTSLTLVDEEDEIIKAVAVSEVRKRELVDKKEKATGKGDDDVWEEDWS